MITKLINFFQRKKVVGEIPTAREIISNEIAFIQCSKHKHDIIMSTVLEVYNSGNEDEAFELIEEFGLIEL